MGHWERRSHILFQHLQISKAAGSIFRRKSCILYDLYFIISTEENNCMFPKEGRKQEARKLFAIKITWIFFLFLFFYFSFCVIISKRNP